MGFALGCFTRNPLCEADRVIDFNEPVYCEVCNELIGYADHAADLSAAGIYCLGCALRSTEEEAHRIQPPLP
jgi:hypothetical protein